MKNLLKMMVAASALTAVSMQASATVTNYTTVITGWLSLYGTLMPPHPINGAHFNGAGTASYDDTTNILSYSHSITFDMDHMFPLGPSVRYQGVPNYPAIATWTQSGTMNLATGTGVNTASGCFDNPDNYLAFCVSGNNADGVPIALDYVTTDSVASPASVNYGWESYPYGPDFGNITAMTMALTPVPVPAAAWLFGSALLGLAGIGRRCAGAGVAPIPGKKIV